MALGKISHTGRGFELIEFEDRYGEKCSLQMSSIADNPYPGTSAIWLGCDSLKDEDRTRMHLNRSQVADLILHLQAWLEHGSFKID